MVLINFQLWARNRKIPVGGSFNFRGVFNNQGKRLSYSPGVKHWSCLVVVVAAAGRKPPLHLHESIKNRRAVVNCCSCLFACLFVLIALCCLFVRLLVCVFVCFIVTDAQAQAEADCVKVDGRWIRV